MPRLTIFLCFLFLNFITHTANADKVELKPFAAGSYQQLLESHAKKPFMLVIWSITCSSCLKDMALLNKMHKTNPKIKMVMLSTDDASATEQVQIILEKNELTGLENWLFADENPQKLRYEIDSKWYGELPRTYFFNKNHERKGVSGVLSQKDYEAMFKEFLN
jgi:hypothetical protein